MPKMSKVEKSAFSPLPEDHRYEQMGVVFPAGVNDVFSFVTRGGQRHAGEHRALQVVASHNETQLLPRVPTHTGGPDRDVDWDDLSGAQKFFCGVRQKRL